MTADAADGMAGRQPSIGSNTVWSVVQYGLGRTVTFVTTIVLARILAPEAFGLVALAVLAISIFDRVKDLGIAPSLIQYPGAWERAAPTGLSLTVVSTIAVSIVTGFGAPLLAPLIADGADAEALVPLIRALAFSLLFTGIGLFADAALSRRLLFKYRVIPEVIATLVRSALSIALAVSGAGAWSLVWGQVAGSGVLALGYWVAYRRAGGTPIRPGFDRSVARSLIRTGLPFSYVALLSLVLDNLDYFAIGRQLGATELGYYTIAFRVPEMLVLGTCIAIGKVLYSSFSRVQHDQVKLREQYLRSTAAVTALTVPMGVGIAVTAYPLVAVLFGRNYGPAAPLLVVLGVQAAVYSTTFHTGEVYKALGRTRIMTNFALAQVVVFAIALWFAAGWSTLIVAFAFLGCHAATMIARLALIRHMIGVTVKDQVRMLMPPTFASAIMAAGTWLMGRLVVDQPAAIQLLVLVVTGIVLYVVALRIISPKFFQQHAVVRQVRARLSSIGRR